MGASDRDMVIKQIKEMPEEQVLKVLIFMAGMEAECTTKKTGRTVEKDGGI